MAVTAITAAERRVNLLGLPRAELEAFCAGLGSKPFRARQLMNWLYKRGCDRFEDMSDLARDFRALLAERARAHVCPRSSPCSAPAMAPASGCCAPMPAQAFEMVYIPETDRGTLCISSQVGCALDCAFCSTAQQGFNRNLSTAEIVGQVWLANRELGFQPGGDRIITNVVLMGMGEPLANFRNVVPALRILLDDLGFDLSRRRVTLSTSGLVPQIYRLAQEINVALAVSLHAPDDALRSQLVPINRLHPIAELLEACWHYIDEQNGRSVTFEYVMLDGVNDCAGAGARAGAAARRASGQGESDPVQSVSRHAVPALERGRHRPVSRRAAARRRDGDGAAHARRGYRRGLRPAGRPRDRSHRGAPGQQGAAAQARSARGR